MVSFKNNRLIIGENKKTSKFAESSKMQLAYYLKLLNDAGIQAEGRLHYLDEKKVIKLKLDEELEKNLIKQKAEINEIILMEFPPKVKMCKYCRNCAYNQYCFS